MYKKTALIVISFLLSGIVYACECIPGLLLNRIGEADFIAKVKIVSFAPDKKNDDFYIATISMIELYKGMPTDTLKISQRNTSCAILTPENTTWLIFANKDKDGKLVFSLCSGPLQLDRTFTDLSEKGRRNVKEAISLKLAVLDFLKKEKINPSNTYDLLYSLNLKGSNLNGFELTDKRFALYKIKINPDLTIKEIKSLTTFDNKKIAATLFDVIKKELRFRTPDKKTTIPQATEIIIAVYAYYLEDYKQGFLTMLDL